MPKTLLATLVAVAFIITGCSAPAENTEASVPAEPETEEAGPTVEEFASVIAESRGAVDDWLDEWDEHICSSMTVAEGDPLCEVSLMGGSLVAETARTKLNSATKEDSLVYLGDPPDKIAIIWQSTEDAAIAAAEAGSAIPEDCSTSEGCAGKVMDFTMAMETLQRKYDSWAPYM